MLYYIILCYIIVHYVQLINLSLLTFAEENLKSLEPKEAGKWMKYLLLKSSFYQSAVSITSFYQSAVSITSFYQSAVSITSFYQSAISSEYY